MTYPGSVHFQDPAGKWQNIDDTFVSTHRAGYAYENRANSYTALFPATLGSQPVKFHLGPNWVAFGLVGADAHVSVSANTANYAAALPGVSVQYSSMNDELKETLTLADAGETSFTYDLTMSEGLTAQVGALGSVDFVSRAGKVKGTVPLI